MRFPLFRGQGRTGREEGTGRGKNEASQGHSSPSSQQRPQRRQRHHLAVLVDRAKKQLQRGRPGRPGRRPHRFGRNHSSLPLLANHHGEKKTNGKNTDDDDDDSNRNGSSHSSSTTSSNSDENLFADTDDFVSDAAKILIEAGKLIEIGLADSGIVGTGGGQQNSFSLVSLSSSVGEDESEEGGDEDDVDSQDYEDEEDVLQQIYRTMSGDDDGTTDEADRSFIATPEDFILSAIDIFEWNTTTTPMTTTMTKEDEKQKEQLKVQQQQQRQKGLESSPPPPLLRDETLKSHGHDQGDDGSIVTDQGMMISWKRKQHRQLDDNNDDDDDNDYSHLSPHNVNRLIEAITNNPVALERLLERLKHREPTMMVEQKYDNDGDDEGEEEDDDEDCQFLLSQSLSSRSDKTTERAKRSSISRSSGWARLRRGLSGKSNSKKQVQEPASDVEKSLSKQIQDLERVLLLAKARQKQQQQQQQQQQPQQQDQRYGKKATDNVRLNQSSPEVLTSSSPSSTARGNDNKVAVASDLSVLDSIHLIDATTNGAEHGGRIDAAVATGVVLHDATTADRDLDSIDAVRAQLLSKKNNRGVKAKWKRAFDKVRRNGRHTTKKTHETEHGVLAVAATPLDSQDENGVSCEMAETRTDDYQESSCIGKKVLGEEKAHGEKTDEEFSDDMENGIIGAGTVVVSVVNNGVKAEDPDYNADVGTKKDEEEVAVQDEDVSDDEDVDVLEQTKDQGNGGDDDDDDDEEDEVTMTLAEYFFHAAMASCNPCPKESRIEDDPLDGDEESNPHDKATEPNTDAVVENEDEGESIDFRGDTKKLDAEALQQSINHGAPVIDLEMNEDEVATPTFVAKSVTRQVDDTTEETNLLIAETGPVSRGRAEGIGDDTDDDDKSNETETAKVLSRTIGTQTNFDLDLKETTQKSKKSRSTWRLEPKKLKFKGFGRKKAQTVEIVEPKEDNNPINKEKAETESTLTEPETPTPMSPMDVETDRTNECPNSRPLPFFPMDISIIELECSEGIELADLTLMEKTEATGDRSEEMLLHVRDYVSIIDVATGDGTSKVPSEFKGAVEHDVFAEEEKKEDDTAVPEAVVPSLSLQCLETNVSIKELSASISKSSVDDTPQEAGIGIGQPNMSQPSQRMP